MIKQSILVLQTTRGVMKSINFLFFVFSILMVINSNEVFSTIVKRNVQFEFSVPSGTGVEFIGLGLPLANVSYEIKNILKPILKLEIVADDDNKATKVKEWVKLFRTAVNVDILNVFLATSVNNFRNPHGYGSCRKVDNWYKDVIVTRRLSPKAWSVVFGVWLKSVVGWTLILIQ